MANMPYIVSEITPKGATTLKKRGDEILKVKYNLSQFKLYVKRSVDTGGDTTEFIMASVNTGTSTTLSCNETNYWDSLPNALVEKFFCAELKNLGSRHATCTKTLSKRAEGYFTLRFFTCVP